MNYLQKKLKISNNSKILNVGISILGILILLIPLTHKEMFSFFLPDLTLSKFVLLVLALFGILILITNIRNLINDVFFKLYGCLILFQILSLIKTYDYESTLYFILYNLSVLLAYISIKEILKKLNSLNIIANFYAVSVLFTFIFLVVQMYVFNTFDRTIGGIWPVAGFPTRYGSTFWDVNHYGAYLVSSIFLLLGFVFSKSTKNEKILYIASIISAVISLYFTASRSAMIGLFSSFSVFLFLLTIKLGNKFNIDILKFKKLLLATLSIFILSPIFLTFLFQDQFKASFLYRAVSFYSHMFLLKVGITTGLTNPVFGVGANAFYEYFKNSELSAAYYYVDPAALNFKLPLHNLWLENFAETGIIAMIIFISIWVSLISLLYSNYKKNNDLIALGFLCGIISFLVGGIFYSYKNEFFWVFVLISFAYSIINTKKDVFTENNLKNFISIKSLLYILFAINMLLPISSLLKNIQPSEINLFYYQSSIIINNAYIYCIKLFRFVYGNYSFIGRSISLLFYISACLLFNLTFYKKLKANLVILLFIITSCVCSYYYPLGSVSFVSIYFFIVTLVLFVADLYIKPVFKIFKPLNLNINSHLVFTLIVVFTAININNNIKFFNSSKEYDNLVFITELANNRGLFENSNIYIDTTIDPSVLSYFCDKLDRKNKSFEFKKCQYTKITNFELNQLNPTQKEVYIYSSDNEPDETNLKNEFYKFALIASGKTKLIFHEKMKVSY